MKKKIYSFEIKRRGKLIFNLEFKEIKKDEYNLIYNYNFKELDRLYKKSDEKIVIQGYIMRLLSGLYTVFKIEPQNKEIAFDPVLDISFKTKTDKKELIDIFNTLRINLENLIKPKKNIISIKNKEMIENYYKNKENDLEYFIIFDKHKNLIKEIYKKDILKQGNSVIDFFLDLRLVEDVKQPIFIHNHKNSLIFSENDIKSYKLLKKYIEKKFNFMIYVVEKNILIDYETFKIM